MKSRKLDLPLLSQSLEIQRDLHHQDLTLLDQIQQDLSQQEQFLLCQEELQELLVSIQGIFLLCHIESFFIK